MVDVEEGTTLDPASVAVSDSVPVTLDVLSLDFPGTVTVLFTLLPMTGTLCCTRPVVVLSFPVEGSGTLRKLLADRVLFVGALLLLPFLLLMRSLEEVGLAEEEEEEEEEEEGSVCRLSMTFSLTRGGRGRVAVSFVFFAVPSPPPPKERFSSKSSSHSIMILRKRSS